MKHLLGIFLGKISDLHYRVPGLGSGWVKVTGFEIRAEDLGFWGLWRRAVLGVGLGPADNLFLCSLALLSQTLERIDDDAKNHLTQQIGVSS